ncbi:MarR family transcriptional regulator [Lactobacillus sp. ESL0731]|uniref:MarR family winged helix-turn-helix transcriptional regulator n=1 Tax=unclassified Lactobacillus TaxID=2620435 RepID=UPI0023F90D9B|nr:MULTISPECIES: MarR family transcriptional regulator [unclassified Lactobacillus]WEV52011.1 MarR family transcriptional regulator [Lactobacillus sp. ESL0700]WEV61399.1 MarR family transcriptional regulator [Lactobacillus sp. ESL0731]
MDILCFSTLAAQIKNEISRKCGLNLSQTRILLYFDKSGNQPLKMGSLAKNLNISLSTLSRQLQQKKTLALVEITRSESNSSKSVVLNEAGTQKATELKAALKQIEDVLFKDFSPNDLAQLSTTINQLATKLETVKSL